MWKQEKGIETTVNMCVCAGWRPWWGLPNKFSLVIKPRSRFSLNYASTFSINICHYLMSQAPWVVPLSHSNYPHSWSWTSDHVTRRNVLNFSTPVNHFVGRNLPSSSPHSFPPATTAHDPVSLDSLSPAKVSRDFTTFLPFISLHCGLDT